MEVDDNEEPSLLDASDPSVVEKYKCAGEITNRTLHSLIQQCIPGKTIVELCELGDRMIVDKCEKVYPNLKKRGKKGIAFPTCLSVNHMAGHFSPLSDDKRILRKGDLVKIDMGSHIDGFCAVVAHTIVLGEVSGRKADVVAAAWTAAQASLRLLKAHNKVC